MADTGDITRALTWGALLAKWTEFAGSSVALPRDGEGGRVRRAVPALIGLQAVTHALGELHLLPPSEQPLGLVRAEVLIRGYEAQILATWSPDEPPAAIRDFAQEAWGAFTRGRSE